MMIVPQIRQQGIAIPTILFKGAFEYKNQSKRLINFIDCF